MNELVASGQPTVLVVDDDPLVRLLTGEALSAAGMQVDEADCGEVALEKLAAAAPDIILLDVMMPGPDGFETCGLLRSMPHTAHTPVLMMTGLDDVESITRAYDVGATDFLTKPINYLMLMHRVRYLLRSVRTASQLRESETNLARAQRIARLASWSWSARRECFEWSEVLPALLGVQPDASDLPGTLLALMPQERRDDHAVPLRALFSGVSVEPLEVCVADGAATRSLLISVERGDADDGHENDVLGTVQDVSERRRQEQRILELQYFDDLTRLPNRNYVERQLCHVIEQSRRTQRPFALLSIWLDQFKRINNTLGQKAGNTLLREASERFEACLRSSDTLARQAEISRRPRDHIATDEETLARIDSDEFLVLLPGLRRAEDTSAVAKRIIATLAKPFRVADSDLFLSSSVGIVTCQSGGEEPAVLLKNADAAMHQARDLGRNQYCFFDDEFNRRAAARLSMETRLRRAIDRNELELYYQPMVDVGDQRTRGVEALVRWHDPDGGMVPPDQFIPLAEETGLILAIGDWVLVNACRQLRAWRDAGIDELRVSVNLSAAQFHSGSLADDVAAVLRSTGVDPCALQLEVTETMLMEHTEASGALLAALRELGVTLAVDDFGTGYSSMSYLKHFPLNTLKIDRSFITGLPGRQEDISIARAIVALGHGLGLSVTAEGVETAAQMRMLEELNCDVAQGFLFSRPMPAAKLPAWLGQEPALGLATA